MPLYGTLSLFRTSFPGCYVFPCVSLGCDVSTCKPYVNKASVVDAEIRAAQRERNAKCEPFYDELRGGNLQNERKWELCNYAIIMIAA